MQPLRHVRRASELESPDHFAHMKPATARVVMTSFTLVVLIAGVVVVNSFYHGSFVVGLFLIVLPVLLLAYILPRLLPVRCPKCGNRMRFKRVVIPIAKRPEPREFYGYECETCAQQYLWEGASSGSSLD